jgi:sulfide:quinone oxidoreductase
VAGFEHVYIAGDSGSFPGPDWMPKQAHIADLQAVAAAKNLIASLNGQPADALFKIELVCIIDALNTGTFIMRTEKRAIILPSMRLFHWLKRGFEWWYLKQYR